MVGASVAVGAGVAVGGAGVNVEGGNGVAVGILTDVGVGVSGAAHEVSMRSVAIKFE